MEINEIANKLVEYCRTGNFSRCYEELYDQNAIVSQEPAGAMWEVATGMEELQAKGKKWGDMVEEMHGASVSDPIVAGNYFTCRMVNDVTFKGIGREKMDELCVYEVKNGKIVKEQFFYDVQAGEATV